MTLKLDSFDQFFTSLRKDSVAKLCTDLDTVFAHGENRVKWYGILEFNVPLDTV